MHLEPLPGTHEPSGHGQKGTSPAVVGRMSQQGTGPSRSEASGVGRPRGVSVSPLLALLPSRPEEPSTWTGYVGKMFLAASNYLPTQVSDMMNQDRAFATGRLGFSGHRNICALAT